MESFRNHLETFHYLPAKRVDERLSKSGNERSILLEALNLIQ
jgi:hypothetical protein